MNRGKFIFISIHFKNGTYQSEVFEIPYEIDPRTWTKLHLSGVKYRSFEVKEIPESDYDVLIKYLN